MEKYELMFIVSSNVTEEGLQEVEQKVSSYFNEVINLDKWGMKDFEYPIKKELRGYYYVLVGKIDNKNSKELKHYFQFSKEVLRHLLINVNKEINHPLKETK